MVSILLFAIGSGFIWHGVQIIWVAPMPSQLKRDQPELEPGSAGAFNRFWIDQYAWIGIGLTVLGLAFVMAGVVR